MLRTLWKHTLYPSELCAGGFAESFNFLIAVYRVCLQCFDAVGWAAGRASGL